MLGAGIFVFQLRHLLLGAVEHTAELIGESQIDSRAVHFRTPLELGGQSFPQSIRRHADFLEKRLCYSIALIEKRGQEMLVGNFLMIELRSDILRRLQRLLHLLRELIDAHESKIVNVTGSAIGRKDGASNAQGCHSERHASPARTEEAHSRS